MRIKAKFTENNRTLRVALRDLSKTISASVGEIQRITEYVGGEPYIGDYVVTPKVTEQVMPVKEKVMTDDVTILAIPYYDVSNASGGSTVYIAKEV